MKNKNSLNCSGLFGLHEEMFFEGRLLMKGAGKSGKKAGGPEAEAPTPGAVEATAPAEAPTDASGTDAEKSAPAEGTEAGRVLREGEHELGKLKAGLEAGKHLADLKDKENLPKTPVKLPAEPRMKIETFIEKNFRDVEKALDAWKLSVLRRNSRVKWENWDHSNVEGLQKIYQDCQDLGIINQDKEFYDTMFAILRNSVDSNVNKNLADKQLRNAFMKPSDGASQEKIASLAPDGKFPGGEAFLKAFSHLQFLKATINTQEGLDIATLAKQKDATGDIVGDKVTDFLKSNVATFQKAIRERDYSTAGVYALGIYALYQTVGKKLFGGGGGAHGAGDHGAAGGGDFKKWLLIGAAAYCGNKFMKNAGYDILKMAGFKTSDAEVSGTSLDVLGNILEQSEFSEQTKDLDYGIVLTMATTKLTTLEELRQLAGKAKPKAVSFIHPSKFPDLFPDLKGVRSFDMGLDEEGLKDNTGMSNVKHSPKQREYIRVGQQLFKLALAMNATYDETLRVHHKEYIGKTYQEALQDPVLKHSMVIDFVKSVHDYANEKTAGLFSGKKMQEIEAMLNDGLKGAGFDDDDSFALTEELQDGTRHYKAKLHDFPVVVVAASTGYRVYLQGTYGKAYNSHPGPGIAEIPLSGAEIKAKMASINEVILLKMRELIDESPLLGNKEDLKGSLAYVDGQWQCEVDDPAIEDLGIAGGPRMVIITPDEDGTKINGENLDRASRFPTEILPRLVDEPQFHALSIFLSAGRLDAKFDPATPGQFKLIIGKKKQIEMDIAYDKDKNDFEFAGTSPVQEVDLFRSGSVFAEELADALGENEKLNKTIDTLNKQIDNADEDHIRNFFRSLPNWFTQMTWAEPFRGIKFKNLTGSIAKNYTKSLIEGQKFLILKKMASAASGASTLADIDKKHGQIFVPAVEGLRSIGANFSEASTQKAAEGDDWGEDDFNDTVFSNIAKVGIQSNSYQGFYAQFVQEIYVKYGLDDFRKGNSIKARDVVKVFAHYTAVIDDPSIDGADLAVEVDVKDRDRFMKIKNLEARIGRKLVSTDKSRTVLETLPLYPDEIDTVSNLDDLDRIYALEGTMKEFEKKQKYIQHARYAEYVAGKIFAKYSDGELPKQMTVPVPGDRGFWGIEDYDQWEIHNPPESHDYLDTDERIKMTRDYTTLDEYLKPGFDRSSVNVDDVILPRRNCDFPFKIGSDSLPEDKAGYDLFVRLTKGQSDTDASKNRINDMQLTDAEKIFSEKVDETITKIIDDYGNVAKIEAFNRLRSSFSVSATVDKDPRESTIGGDSFHTYKYRYCDSKLLNPITHRTETKPLDIAREIEGFDKLSSPAVTLTRGVQLRYINSRVEAFFQNNVLSNEAQTRYFNKNSLPKILKNIGGKIHYWLFG